MHTLDRDEVSALRKLAQGSTSPFVSFSFGINSFLMTLISRDPLALPGFTLPSATSLSRSSM